MSERWNDCVPHFLEPETVQIFLFVGFGQSASDSLIGWSIGLRHDDFDRMSFFDKPHAVINENVLSVFFSFNQNSDVYMKKLWVLGIKYLMVLQKGQISSEIPEAIHY